MQRRNAALSLVALVALGTATGCEKQSPWVTVTAGGTVVKARATKYCRENNKCTESTDKPVIDIKQGDTLGIDVPRSVAEHGWRVPNVFGEQLIHDHYRAITIPQVQAGEIDLVVVRDERHGEGEWHFTLRVK